MTTWSLRSAPSSRPAPPQRGASQGARAAASQAIRVGAKRVLRLMRAHQLLAPSRPRHEHGDPAHAGTIITRAPRDGGRRDALLHGARRVVLVLRGRRSLHDRDDGLARRQIGDRWAALEPIRQGLTIASARSRRRSRSRGAASRLGESVHANTFVNEIKCWGSPIRRVRRRAGVQRVRGAIHADAEGAVSLLHQFRDLRRRAGHRRVHRAPTTRSGSWSAWVPDACPGTP